MPTFVETRQWIQSKAVEFGVQISGNKAKALACSLLTQDEDFCTLTYGDPVGDEAVTRALRALADVIDPAPTHHHLYRHNHVPVDAADEEEFAPCM